MVFAASILSGLRWTLAQIVTQKHEIGNRHFNIRFIQTLHWLITHRKRQKNIYIDNTNKYSLSWLRLKVKKIIVFHYLSNLIIVFYDLMKDMSIFEVWMPKRLQFIKIQTMCIYATISHQQWAKPIMHSQPQKDDTWQNRKLLKWENPWVIYNITIQKTNMTNVINQFTTGPKPGTCTQKCRLVSIHPCLYLHMFFFSNTITH